MVDHKQKAAVLLGEGGGSEEVLCCLHSTTLPLYATILQTLVWLSHVRMDFTLYSPWSGSYVSFETYNIHTSAFPLSFSITWATALHYSRFWMTCSRQFMILITVPVKPMNKCARFASTLFSGLSLNQYKNAFHSTSQQSSILCYQ